jgi:Lsr2
MAKTMSVVITDDLDGSAGAETMAFSWRGTAYEIDLAAQNAARLRDALRPFTEAGRPAARPRQARAAQAGMSAPDRAAVRAWAAGQGLQVSERGRISAAVLRGYMAAREG